MKREQVMEMTDEQLRVKAAELMRWEKERCCAEDLREISPCLEGAENTYDCCHLDSGGYWEDCKYKWETSPPDYPNDIAAAIDLVERAIDNGFMMKLKAWSGSLGTVWDCTFDRSDMDVNDSDEKAPRAITRAFISAMEAE